MDYILQLIIAVFFCFKLVASGSTSFMEIFIFLFVVAIYILRYKYISRSWLIWLEFSIICIATFYQPTFMILFTVTVLDFIYEKSYWGVVAILIALFTFCKLEAIPDMLMLFTACGFYGYSKGLQKEKETLYRGMFDKERAYRYELENARQKLLNFAKDSAHLAQIKERNRIAREIHDNIGHSIAGVLMQLQAAYKLSQKDSTKSFELVSKSIEALSNSLTMLRNTVHNIKPLENLGIDYINEIINNFTFCNVKFTHTGNFSELPANIMEAICTNIKEAFTNTAKHSKATEVVVEIQVTSKFVRLYIKDNGIGCIKISNGLGISGMRERVAALGGNLSISSDNGFLIVCFIPQPTLTQ